MTHDIKFDMRNILWKLLFPRVIFLGAKDSGKVLIIIIYYLLLGVQSEVKSVRQRTAHRILSVRYKAGQNWPWQ